MAENIDINPTHLKIVTDILHENLPYDVTVWTFGSRAKWTAKEYSDLDLALESKDGGKIPAEIIARLDDDFEESDLPWKVDVVDINAVVSSFREIIIKDQVRLEDMGNRSNKTSEGRRMSSEWPSVKLEEVTSKLGDGLHGTPNYDPDGAYYFINGNNLRNGKIVISEKTKKCSREEYLKYKKPFTDRTILVSINGTLGNIALYNGEKVFPGKSACYFNVLPEVDKQFVRYIITNKDFQNYIQSLATGSTIKNVSLKLMRNYSFRLPSYNQQLKIGQILKTLDDKIELNQRMNKTLEEMAQAIFKCWFVNFEPTRAKIAQKEGSGESDADICTRLKITPEILSLFPATLTDSELGEIPDGWEVSTIEDEVDINGGSTPSTKNDAFWEGGTFYWSTPKDLSNITSPILLDTNRKITEAGVNKITSGQLPEGTLLMSSRAPVGYLAIAEMPISINQGYIAMGCNKSLSNLFMLFWAKDNMDMIKDHANGSTFQEISKKSFRPLPVLVPNRDVLTEFEKITRPMYENLVINLRQSASLAQIRDTLLPKLLSGEISVGEAENIVGDIEHVPEY